MKNIIAALILGTSVIAAAWILSGRQSRETQDFAGLSERIDQAEQVSRQIIAALSCFDDVFAAPDYLKHTTGHDRWLLSGGASSLQGYAPAAFANRRPVHAGVDPLER